MTHIKRAAIAPDERLLICTEILAAAAGKIVSPAAA
jgi:hypothetical protein